jgi:hypothetical protein
MRARAAGANIILVGSSRINHPPSVQYRLWIPGIASYSLEMPPWKRYYDVRNRIFIARNHSGIKLWYRTLPGNLFHLVSVLWHQDGRRAQMKAFYAGIIDGLLGRKGRRHEKWGFH